MKFEDHNGEGLIIAIFFATVRLLAKFAKIKCAQKFVVLRYISIHTHTHTHTQNEPAIYSLKLLNGLVAFSTVKIKCVRLVDEQTDSLGGST